MPSFGRLLTSGMPMVQLRSRCAFRAWGPRLAGRARLEAESGKTWFAISSLDPPSVHFFPSKAIWNGIVLCHQASHMDAKTHRAYPQRALVRFDTAGRTWNVDKTHARDPRDSFLLQQGNWPLPIHDTTFMCMEQGDVGWTPGVHQQHHAPSIVEASSSIVMEAAPCTW